MSDWENKGSSDREKREYIIQAAQGYTASGVMPDVKLAEAVRWLMDRYDREKDEESLKAALLTVEAYRQMGFFYDLHRELFDRVGELAGAAGMDSYPAERFSTRCIPVTKTQIRKAIGPWPRTVNSHESADWIAEDICERIRSRVLGFTFYQASRKGMILELIVGEDRALLLSAAKNRTVNIIYSLVQTEESGRNENDSHSDL